MPITRIHNKKASLRKRDTFTSSLLNASGKEYLVEVGVGTPPQMFNVTLDTGSGDFWIPSDACPATMCPLTRFNEKGSSTYQTMTPVSKLSIQYGIGFAEGAYSQDTVTLGGASLPNRAVGLVSNTSDILGLTTDTGGIDPSNGIFGLGYPGLSMKDDGHQQIHFVSQLAESKAISDPLFSVFLNPELGAGNSGEVLLGGIDTNKVSGEVQYAPVVSYNLSSYYIVPNLNARSNSANNTYLYWTIPGQSVSASSGYVHNSTELQPYILDTGTTLTYVPPQVAEGIVMSVTKNATTTTLDSFNGVYMVSCDLAKNTQDTVDFEISTSLSAITTNGGAIPIHVKVSDLVIPLDAGATTAAQSQNCMFGIAPASSDLDLTSGETWIIGESVIRSIYTVFDLKQNRVGIAKLSANAGNTATSASSSSSSGTSDTSASNSSGGASSSNGSTQSVSKTNNTSDCTRVVSQVALSLLLMSSVMLII
ncbi:acid protease [Backusella circina FSU 941]|nr:acid protease [Backusella circina FSU 941]